MIYKIASDRRTPFGPVSIDAIVGSLDLLGEEVAALLADVREGSLRPGYKTRHGSRSFPSGALAVPRLGVIQRLETLRNWVDTHRRAALGEIGSDELEARRPALGGGILPEGGPATYSSPIRDVWIASLRLEARIRRLDELLQETER